jgi:ribosome-associated protein
MEDVPIRDESIRLVQLLKLANLVESGSDAREPMIQGLVQVDHEDQGLAGLDHAAGAAVAVAELGRDHELAAAADLHALDALVPAGDDLSDTEAEVQRGAAVVRRVELLTRRVGDADVVHRDGGAGGGLLAVPLGDVGDAQVRGRRAVGEVDLRLVNTHEDHPFTRPSARSRRLRRRG